ncbi:MAG: Hsp20/alpha crystallin family protein, partial [Pyrinomonadaceae bacterium]
RGFGEAGFGRGALKPIVDIYESKDHNVLVAELPGMIKDDFELSVENNVITLRGERQFEKKDETDNYHRVERSYGSFTRSFTLPQTVSAEGATAEYRNGVLRVTLPKREETKARRIEIRGEEGTARKTIETKAETVTPAEKSREAAGGR